VSRGSHAADDGSFGRSAGGAMTRGILLILVAVLLGVVLLNATEGSEPFEAATSSDDGGGGDRGISPSTAATESTTTTAAPVARDPAEVTVYVVNGSGVPGAAARLTETLRSENYVTTEPGNVETVESSRIYYVAGYEADANAVATLLTPPPAVEEMPDPAPVDDLRGAQILVVMAADLAGGG
jgi:hypothetical protein